MRPDDLSRVARAIYGDRWQRDLARGLRIAERTVRYWAAGEREVPDHYADLLLAIEPLADHLAMREQPKGASLIGRLVEVATARA
ncbi:hypothetical protein WV31_10810 [Magnetospirillum sp. ME-1]|uniref:hypothetical protein n=1 Tax=unclassified Magnetospirillum TaxID=2617991 RepID=UPI0008389A13|nr:MULTISPECIES: hypothetical protein [unclassified Magnetospirillum]ARJ66118.1 hypothetical protein WV31_10810 [Magnetospirillum sp. ME-1]